MDKSVPTGAAMLLAFIYETETSRKPPECYEVIYGHNQRKLKKPLTKMTLGEVIDAQKKWSKNFGSSAAGAGQFMRATLQGLAKELGLNGNQLFDADFQDRLGYHLLKRRGYEQFMAGKLGTSEFGKHLAQEWASFPVLIPTQGAQRWLGRGQSYYAGDGVNKALVTPAAVEAVLLEVKYSGRQAPKPAIPDPELEAIKKLPPASSKPVPVAKRGFLSGVVDVLLVLFRGWR